MKTTITLISLIVIGIILYFFVLGYFSKAHAAPGLVSGQLSKCSSKPNCVCSEYIKDTQHFIPPIKISNTETDKTMQQLKTVLENMGATTISIAHSYIAATFTSSIFRFVDDFEIRIDEEAQLIHIRSASRVGTSDLGVNRKRVNTFKSMIEKR